MTKNDETFLPSAVWREGDEQQATHKTLEELILHRRTTC
jgi:hypothetical protein